MIVNNLYTKPFKTLIYIFFIETHTGFRSAPTHFASNETKMIIASVPYNGELPENLEFNWEIEHIIELGADMREAYFLRRDFKPYFYLMYIIAKILSLRTRSKNPIAAWVQRANSKVN